jgi:hypothetical protein
VITKLSNSHRVHVAIVSPVRRGQRVIDANEVPFLAINRTDTHGGGRSPLSRAV